jgi:hypothetical protein
LVPFRLPPEQSATPADSYRADAFSPCGHSRMLARPRIF